jgi:hypothetical protein
MSSEKLPHQFQRGMICFIENQTLGIDAPEIDHSAIDFQIELSRC